jgi:hypothetical protein
MRMWNFTPILMNIELLDLINVIMVGMLYLVVRTHFVRWNPSPFLYC